MEGHEQGGRDVDRKGMKEVLFMFFVTVHSITVSFQVSKCVNHTTQQSTTFSHVMFQEVVNAALKPPPTKQ